MLLTASVAVVLEDWRIQTREQNSVSDSMTTHTMVERPMCFV